MKKVKLTKFEEYVYKNCNRDFKVVAGETNRSLKSVESAYTRAIKKMLIAK